MSAIALLGTSCALTFPDYELEKGAGGAGATSGDPSGSSTSSLGGPPGCTRTVLAIDQLFLGDTLPDGSPSPSAWRMYGADIDGLDGYDKAIHCMPSSGADPDIVFGDGDDGIDNSFGFWILPGLEAFAVNINASITSGNIGYLIDIVDLTAMPTQTGLTTRFYAGAHLGHQPSFDGEFCWPIDGATVVDPNDPTSATVIFEDGVLAEHEWFSGAPQKLELILEYQGTEVPLTLHQARVWAPLTVDHNATVTGAVGRISGVLDTEEFVAVASRYTATESPETCMFFPALATAIRQGSDILVDGTQDPGTVCNGISVGIGFTAKPVRLGAVGEASTLPTTPCPER